MGGELDGFETTLEVPPGASQFQLEVRAGDNWKACERPEWGAASCRWSLAEATPESVAAKFGDGIYRADWRAEDARKKKGFSKPFVCRKGAPSAEHQTQSDDALEPAAADPTANLIKHLAPLINQAVSDAIDRREMERARLRPGGAPPARAAYGQPPMAAQTPGLNDVMGTFRTIRADANAESARSTEREQRMWTAFNKQQADLYTNAIAATQLEHKNAMDRDRQRHELVMLETKNLHEQRLEIQGQELTKLREALESSHEKLLETEHERSEAERLLDLDEDDAKLEQVKEIVLGALSSDLGGAVQEFLKQQLLASAKLKAV